MLKAFKSFLKLLDKSFSKLLKVVKVSESFLKLQKAL